MTGKSPRTPKPRDPIATQHAQAIQRMREIANQSVDALYLCDASVHPDHVLLGLCAEAMHAHKRAEHLMALYHSASDEMPSSRDNVLTHGAVLTLKQYGSPEALDAALRDSTAREKAESALRDDCHKLFTAAQDWRRQTTNAGRRAAKLRATTPAGIYAKALLVKGSAGSAAVLAMSLAEDFVACEGLRSSLWPAAPATEVRS